VDFVPRQDHQIGVGGQRRTGWGTMVKAHRRLCRQSGQASSKLAMRDQASGQTMWKPPADGQRDRSTASSARQQMLHGEPWQAVQKTVRSRCGVQSRDGIPRRNRLDIAAKTVDQKAGDSSLHLRVHGHLRADDLGR